ncbi:hypothetical protein DH2020_020531 [Rehmannia glutinosa]|uniref:Uncharacterized protein n=1 Tax=Rehmannia glutinosa TaxID=99300 RepID=A0ABR0WGW8_REHGL
MKVNVISRKLIKPSTPTPQNLKKYQLSFLDEISPPWNVSVILFYPPNPNPKPILIAHFEDSLAKILPQFYPFAGRYNKKDDHKVIDCNDEGAEFVEAEATEVEMMDFIKNSKNDRCFLNNNLLSRQPYYEADKPTDPLLSIQITEFKSCGGLAISIGVSHKIADASSVGTFIAALSSIANTTYNPGDDQRSSNIIIPSFDSRMLFPGKINVSNDYELPKNIVVKRLYFNKEAISSLRSKLSRDQGRFLSRVRLVSAVIAKALIGVDRAKQGKSRSCFIVQSVDMRGRTIPPLPKHSCGNLVLQSITETNNEDKNNIGLHELVRLIGDSIDKTITDCAKLLSIGEDERKDFIIYPMAKSLKRLLSGEISYAMWFSDWSKFGFYEADFGWGKPVWASIGTFPSQNLTLLMSNKEGDGIEAWVHLNQDDMPYFDQDEEIKLFTLL